MENETSKPLNIYQRINEVRRTVGYLQKDGQVQGYKVVTHDLVTSAVRQHFVDHGIIVVPEELESSLSDSGSVTGKGVKVWRFEAKYDISFVNMDSPDQIISVKISAHALDHGDKAPGKALSYATKYAMLKLLSIETGESDEGREDQKPAAKAIDLQRTIQLGKAIERHKNSIEIIKDSIMRGNYSEGSEAWYELTHDEMKSIWVAPTNGGPFTSDERAIMKSKEWREAYYGQEVTEKESTKEEKSECPKA